MKNKFYNITLATVVILLSTLSGYAQQTKGTDIEYYQISVYHTSSQQQLDSLSRYLQQSYVPALHRAGFSKVGVFMPLANDTSANKRIVTWMPFAALAQLNKVSYNAVAPHYARLENILLSAFPKAPHYQLPKLSGPAAAHIFELRSYESPTEERYLSKEKMFNKGNEVDLFARLGFNAVFYARVMAGSRMPNLMYLTSFNSQQAHDEHWKAFGDDAEWKKLSGLPEYQKNVNKADIMLMHPAAYSDIR